MTIHWGKWTIKYAALLVSTIRTHVGMFSEKPFLEFLVKFQFFRRLSWAFKMSNVRSSSLSDLTFLCAKKCGRSRIWSNIRCIYTQSFSYFILTILTNYIDQFDRFNQQHIHECAELAYDFHEKPIAL